MERCVVALTSSSVNEEAYSEIKAQLDANSVCPKLIIFFSELDMLWFFSARLKENYPDATVIGSSTYVNYSCEGYSHSGACVMAINDGVEVSAGLLFDIDRHPAMYKVHIQEALSKLSSYENTCCLEFMTAFGKGEELVLDTFEEVLEGTGIKVAGGSSGAAADCTDTFVALNGDIFKNTCAFVFIHNLNGKVGIFRENMFKPTSHKLVATYADCEERIVFEYNERPAAVVLAEALGISVSELSEVLYIHPMGRIAGNEIYITEAEKIYEDGSISYFSRIYNQTKILLLEVDDVRRVWKETENRVLENIKQPSFTISVNCLARSKYFENQGCFGEFVNALRSYGKFIGVSGYGEQMDFIHLNQSMVLLVFE